MPLREVERTLYCNKQKVDAWICNFSDCSMRGNTHIIIREVDFKLNMMEESLEESSILYQWGTKTAQQTCGILPWYRPRSNVDGYVITLNCIDWGQKEKPEVEMKHFDGHHSEDFYAQSKISEQSKTTFV
jgi:hypothetical protein